MSGHGINEFADIQVGDTEVLEFRVTEEDVLNFAGLTGDHSSIHVDDFFSRKSRYRERIVHGMLPFTYLCALAMLNPKNQVCRVIQLKADFTSPIYLGANLRLVAEVLEKDDVNQNLKLDIAIKPHDSGSSVANGLIVVGFGGGDRPEAGIRGSNQNPCLLIKKIEESKFLFEEINEGLKSSIDFSMEGQHFSALARMFSKSLNRRFESVSQLFIDIVALSLFSTFIGMRIPGQNATFLGFDVSFLEQLPLLTEFKLKGEVTKKSQATHLVKLSLAIEDSQNVYVKGEAVAMVNDPSPKIPSFSDILSNSTDLGLKGKIVLVTGASRGIGESTAKLFAAIGASVIVNYYRGKSDAEKIVREITEGGGEAVALYADVSKKDDVREMVASACAKYGKIDVLVNNAVRDAIPQDFMELEWSEIQKDIDVTLKGAFNCCKEVIPCMIKNGGGSIINVSTVYTENPPPKQFKYVVSKSGVTGLTRCLAAEYASKNIRVNMVVPSFVETDLVSGVPVAFRKKFAASSPMKRNAKPIEVAQAVVFLASVFSSFTTGQRIMVTGGGPFL